MIVRSNVLRRGDVVNAVLGVPGVSFIDVGNVEGWYVPVREFKPKRFERGFELFLTGSSKYNAAHQGGQGGYEKAATWDEWGRVIDALYTLDPNAQVGHYTSRADFLAKTREEHDRIAQWHDPNGYQAQCHRAPWLEAQDEWQRRDDAITKALGIAPGETLVIELDDGVQLDAKLDRLDFIDGPCEDGDYETTGTVSDYEDTWGFDRVTLVYDGERLVGQLAPHAEAEGDTLVVVTGKSTIRVPAYGLRLEVV